MCKMPKALGPYVIKLGNYTVVKFRNPFDDNMKFVLNTEPSTFTLEAKNINVLGKSDYNIKVSTYTSKADDIFGTFPISGKLTVTMDQCMCPNGCDIKWVYYLQCII